MNLIQNKNSKIKVHYSLKYILNSFIHLIQDAIKIIVKSIWRILVFLAVCILVFGVSGALVGGYFYLSTVGEIPKLTDPNKIALPQDSIIYDVDGEKIGIITSQRRYIVAGEEISPNIKEALVSIEDERYFNHSGVDMIGIARALYVNYQSWRAGGKGIVQGASTITQQYVRHAYLIPDRTVKRKLQEITLAVQLEAQLSKQEILDRYLNVIYFGNGNYGIEAASRYYFNKHASELTVPESAILAACVNNANLYDPAEEEGRAKVIKRSHLVLNKMYQLGYITRIELLEYKSIDMNSLFNIQKITRDIPYPYYYDYTMSELLKTYSKEEIYTGGWSVYTTLSIKKYKLMKKAISKELGEGLPTAAMADVNPQTGAINAFWGGFDYNKSNFNLATQGKRQPGSSFKPFVYATAFKQGMRNDTPFSNAPLTIQDDRGVPWHVVPDSNARNLEQGLAYSDNAMAARLIQKTGIQPVIKTAHELGITSDINEDLAIALGGLTYGVSPLEMASAYSTFANQGVHNPIYSVQRIENSYGDLIYEHKVKSVKVLNTEIAAMMNKSLQGVVQYGTASKTISLKNKQKIAGKTGTTDDHADTWFIGYTTNFTASVWIGYPDSRQPVNNIKGQAAWGGTFTAKIWNNYASDILANTEKKDFPAPKGLVEVPTIAEFKTVEKMENQLENLGLKYTIKEIADKTKKNNELISVEKSGDLVLIGSTITITVAVSKYTVPNFVGMKPYDAIALVNSTENNAFKVSFSFEIDDTIPADKSGTIYKQSVKANELTPGGSEILLTLKFQTPKPKEVIKEVPKLYIPTDSELASLQEQILLLNEQIKTLTNEKNVLNANLLSERAKMKLIMPNLVGIDIQLAKRLATEVGFIVTLKNPTGLVSAQSIMAGTQPINNKLTLTGDSQL